MLLLLGLLGLGAFIILIFSFLGSVAIFGKLFMVEKKVKNLEKEGKLNPDSKSELQILTEEANKLFVNIENFQNDLENNSNYFSDEEYENLQKPLLDDSESFYTDGTNPYQPAEPNEEILRILETFKDFINQIHNGIFPIWSEFFAIAKQLDEEYFSDFGDSTSLADELMSVYELMDVEAIYTDESFMDEVLKLHPDHIHFICFILTSGFQEKINSRILSRIWENLKQNKELIDCYDCGMNQWWGNPFAYLANQVNLPSAKLHEIYVFTNLLENVYEFEKDIILCSLANNESTPFQVLQKLAKVNKYALKAADDQCPFWIKNDKESSNISVQAKRNISKRQNHEKRSNGK